MRYEDLLENTRDTMQMICSFLGLPYEETMVSLKQSAENLGDAKGKDCVVKDNTGKWQGVISESLARKIEGVCGEVLLASGYALRYEVSCKRISSIRMRMYQVMDGASLLIFTLKTERTPINILRTLRSSILFGMSRSRSH